ncbi:MAG: aminotransferase class V-fold PLP-dependent enzyme [Rhodococcus sp. (in: high G+C Gram-positive bacteria)]|uniref:aminotransferase class V-fold PLP-dependent enzyme n=1 Tax=Rhodococcus sp. TaxID=1831 RepID=UPI003BB70162
MTTTALTESPHDTLTRLAEWQSGLREQFPIITGNPGLVYLDSSATAQKPRPVLDAVHHYLTTTNANAGRGTYEWANRTTELMDIGRDTVRRFLGDAGDGPSTVTFVDGTSTGLRRVAMDWLMSELRDGDEIIVPFADHQANNAPWLEASAELARRGTHIVVHALPYEQSGSGDYDIDALAQLVTPRTRFVAVTHVHHVYGNDMNVHRIRRVCGPDIVICLDAAQSVGHMPVDVGAVDVDFVVFSGHKAMALPGIGAIWARNTRGEAFAPHGWSGSPNTSGVVSVITALGWLSDAGLREIHDWTVSLGAVVTDALAGCESYELLGCQESLTLESRVQRRQGIVTFRHRQVSANDLGFVLAGAGFMVRADGHCQAGDRGTESSVRVSVHAYNTLDEVDRLITVLRDLDSAR